MLFKKPKSEKDPEPNKKTEKPRSMHYYDQFGALQAYANRAMLLAFLCVPTTLFAVALAVYVRVQPPTVIRVNESGEAVPLSRKSVAGTSQITVAQGADAGPNDLDKRAY